MSSNVECDRQHQLLVVKATAADNEASCLIDTGATHNFVSRDFISKTRCSTVCLPQDIAITMADGSKQVATREETTMDLRIGERNKTITLTIIPKAKYDIILGKPWLWKNNPQIDFRTNEIRLPNPEAPCTESVRASAGISAKPCKQTPVVGEDSMSGNHPLLPM